MTIQTVDDRIKRMRADLKVLLKASKIFLKQSQATKDTDYTDAAWPDNEMSQIEQGISNLETKMRRMHRSLIGADKTQSLWSDAGLFHEPKDRM